MLPSQKLKGVKAKNKQTKTPSLKKCRRDTSASDANPKKIIGALALCFNSRRLITSAQHTVLLEG